MFSNYDLIHQVSGGGAGLDRILFHSLKQKLTNQVISTITNNLAVFIKNNSERPVDALAVEFWKR